MEKLTISSFTRDQMIVDGHIGLELEVEGKHRAPPNINNDWWQTVDEPSLRHGREYITKGPLPFNNTFFNKLSTITSAIDQPVHEIDKGSHRTSVHVHANVTKLTPVETWTAIASYWIIENLLYKFFNKERESNLFCQRLRDAEGILDLVENDLEDNVPFRNFNLDIAKYGGINIASVYQKGSLEFRGMHGSLDAEEIYGWCDTLNSLVNKITKFYGSPKELLDDVYFKGWLKVYERYLTKDVITAMKAVPKCDDLIDENIFRITAFIYGTNWDVYSKRLKKPGVGPKRIPKGGQFNAAMQVVIDDMPDIDPPIRWRNN